MKTTITLAFLSLALCCSSTAYADTFGNGVNTFDIDLVTIGNPGNTADTTGNPNSAGSVAYTYRISKYEISRDMIGKANSEGGLGITLADLSGFGGNGPDRPASGIVWFEAARFANWLNTSTGSSPAYKFDSGGNLQLWESGDAGHDPNNLYRNSLAKYFLPSMDEWYKAAYYDPTANVYHDYPTGSDLEPTPVVSGTTAGTAVHEVSGPADITQAGGLSPYGTMGQGGNVWEWEETEYDMVNDSPSSDRGSRGGDWKHRHSPSIQAWARLELDPSYNGSNFGFRIASIPEPSTLLLGALAAAALLVRRRSLR